VIHYTLTTGDSRPSPRDEVDAGLLDALLPSLAQVGQGYQPLPGPLGERYQLRLDAAGRALLATVQTTIGADQRAPLATWGVCLDQVDEQPLWQQLLGLQRQLAAVMPAHQHRPQIPASRPWCAVVLLPGLLHDPAAAQWLGDCERCLAWAWVEGTR